MAVLDRAALKAFFETGDKPTQAQFADLIDSLLALADDNAIENTITSAVPILGTGLGGQVLKRGAVTYALGEFSDNDHWFTTDGGAGVVGSAVFVSSSATQFFFDGILKAEFTGSAVRFFQGTSSLNMNLSTTSINGGGLGTPNIKLDTKMRLQNIPAFADDAAAGLGGLVIDDVYQTSGAGAAPLNVAGILVLKQ